MNFNQKKRNKSFVSIESPEVEARVDLQTAPRAEQNLKAEDERRRIAAALEDVTPGMLTFPVWSNTSAEPHRPEEIEDLLVRQVVSPVRFSQSLRSMASTGIDTFIHIGPGDVTAGMARRSVPDAEVLAISTLEDIPSAASFLGTIA